MSGNTILKRMFDGEWGIVGYIELAKGGNKERAFMDTIINLRFPLYSGKFFSYCINGGLSRIALFQSVTWLLSLSVGGYFLHT
jgi:hypothetical protein